MVITKKFKESFMRKFHATNTTDVEYARQLITAG
jgi:hypothetical protein